MNRSVYLLTFPGQAKFSKFLTSVCAHTFTSKWQLPFLNQRKRGGGGGENDRWNDFMINLHESYVVELGFELSTPGPAVRYAIDCAIELGSGINV